MDFLDPRRRKSHRRRLAIGYALMSIVIGIGTLIILYLAYGYDIDRESGEVIQNGIVFVDSKPRGASIFVNDIRQGSRTDTRMVLPAGMYKIRLEADGFNNWERTFSLEGGQIQRIVYPFLIPNELSSTDIAQYEALPSLTSQSPDRRWILVQRPGQAYQFDKYDLTDPARAPLAIAFPTNILTEPGTAARLQVLEWSSNNNHMLIERVFGAKTEYLLFNHDNPSESININTTLGVSPVKINLKNSRPDQIYFLDAIPGILRSANLKDKTISAPLLPAVITYKTHGDDSILYATQENVEKSKTEFRIFEAGKIYPLKLVNQSDAYVLDVSRYENRWYYVVGSAADNMAFVYENPLPALKQEIKTPLIIAGILRMDNLRYVSFSASSQFIGLQNGKDIITLDLENNHQYRIALNYDIPLTQKIRWMDAYRYIYVVNNQTYIIDFDGSNEVPLIMSNTAIEPYFDKDFENMFSLQTSKQDSTKSSLTITDLRP